MLLANRSHRDGSGVYIETRADQVIGVIIGIVGWMKSTGPKTRIGKATPTIVFETPVLRGSPKSMIEQTIRTYQAQRDADSK